MQTFVDALAVVVLAIHLILTAIVLLGVITVFVKEKMGMTDPQDEELYWRMERVDRSSLGGMRGYEFLRHLDKLFEQSGKRGQSLQQAMLDFGIKVDTMDDAEYYEIMALQELINGHV